MKRVFQLFIQLLLRRWERLWKRVHLIHLKHHKNVCVYAYLNKHRLCGMPNTISCATVNAFLCNPLRSGLENLKSV